MTFIGEIGSQRSYLITEKWFVPSTDTPFVIVPDSLLGRVTLNDSLRRLGAVQIQHQAESVIELDTSFYNSWLLPLPRSVYKMTQGLGPSYNLVDEINQLASNQTYTTPIAIEQNAWREIPAEVENVLPSTYWSIFPPLPWLKKPLQVNQTWVRYQFIDTSNGQIRQQTSAKVVGIENIAVQAGTFSAYKLVLFHMGGSPPELSTEFEYWVPNVGLVLYVVDRYVCRTANHPNGGSTTICFRQVIRKELTSFNVRQ